jgi:hypothetical protein
VRNRIYRVGLESDGMSEGLFKVELRCGRVEAGGSGGPLLVDTPSGTMVAGVLAPALDWSGRLTFVESAG